MKIETINKLEKGIFVFVAIFFLCAIHETAKYLGMGIYYFVSGITEYTGWYVAFAVLGAVVTGAVVLLFKVVEGGPDDSDYAAGDYSEPDYDCWDDGGDMDP